MRIAMSLLAMSLAMAACKKDKAEAPAPGAGSMVAGSADPGSAGSAMVDPGAGSAAAGSAAAADPAAMANKAGNCPSTVVGAKTTAAIKGSDVVLTVTSDDKDAVTAIQRRTEALLKEKADGATGPAGAHDQKGTHGGGQGLCPVYVGDGGTAKATNDATGVTIAITPKAGAADATEMLKKTIDERIAKAAAFVDSNFKGGDAGTQGGVGGGRGEHGGNHSGSGDGKGKDRHGTGSGGGKGTGGGGGMGTGGGGSKGSAAGSGSGS